MLGKYLLVRHFSSISYIFSGVYREGETPVPIPNTEVKDLIGDGTAYLTVGE